MGPDEWTVRLVDTRSPHVWPGELKRAVLLPRGLHHSPSNCWPRGSCFAECICTSSAEQYLTGRALASAAGMTVCSVQLSQRWREFLCFPSSENISPCEAQWIISKSDAIVPFATPRQDSACYIFQISLGEFSLLVRWLLHHVTRMHLQLVQNTFPSRKLLGNFSL